ncbi:GWT1 [Macleaya cordata]|uniref:GWT1 n=1 Tax=Macleaya cordata TaxID=56857 RepID=A0A200QN60_MACCD|nr:GWT1 [Macleaya cordata]
MGLEMKEVSLNYDISAIPLFISSSMDPLGKSFNPDKHLKEEFVSNLTGSSMLEIASLSTIVPALILLRHSFCFKGLCDSLHSMKTTSKKNENATIDCRSWRAFMDTLAIDFLFIVLPILLFLTVLEEWTHICAVCLIFLLLLRIGDRRLGSYSKRGSELAYSARENVSAYRVSMMIVTCLCILAVDFKIFPRRYAKTETYGTGLMDLGVGSFVLANSLVSRQARNVLSMKWKTVLQSTSPLIILGVGRLIFTAGVDYQVHVGEYGVHWNFFFTLAAVSILTSLINISPQYCGILGLSILIGYQICLMCGLNEFLLSKERAKDVISQNKEGLFSIFGYWGMYLVGVQLGNFLFFGNNQRTRTRIWLLAVIFWLLTIILDRNVERVSRRMCNLAYVMFVLAQNFQVLAILVLSDFLPGRKTSVLEEVFNRNLLGSFLLANVMTGLINMNMNTISASSITALVILVGYAFVLSVLSGFTAFSGIKLKFW